MDRFGGLDVLVNCVGIFDFYRKLESIDADMLDQAFDEMFAVNVKSHLHSVKAAIPALRESGGSIVLTESTSAYYPGRGGTLYVASKFAVRGLVTTLAYELAPDIRVNGVAPGGTLGTDLSGLATLGLTDNRLDGAGPGEGTRGPQPAGRRARRPRPRLELRIPRLRPVARHLRPRRPLGRRYGHQSLSAVVRATY